MQQVLMIKTFDGKLHEGVNEARRHLTKLESDLMSRLGHGLHMKKFVEAQDYIDANLDSFLTLKTIRKDWNEIIPLEQYQD